MGRKLKITKKKFAVHETVSGHEKAITPFFDTKQELIRHLVEKGTEWDAPLNKKTAEEFVLRTKHAPCGGLNAGKFLKGFELVELKAQKSL